MRLVEPRDPVLLRALIFAKGGNQTPIRILWICQNFLSDRAEVEDWDRVQMSKNLTRLSDQDLVTRPPPENTGLYRITTLGKAAFIHYNLTGETDASAVELMRQGYFDRQEFETEGPEYSETGDMADRIED